MLPRVRITELLHEVRRSTGFAAAFVNLRTGEAATTRMLLLAAILADGTKLGMARMAEASQGVTRDQPGLDGRRRTRQRWSGSSMHITGCRLPPSGAPVRPPRRTGSSSTPASAAMSPVRSMPATSSIPASASTPMSRTCTLPTVSGDLRGNPRGPSCARRPAAPWHQFEDRHRLRRYWGRIGPCVQSLRDARLPFLPPAARLPDRKLASIEPRPPCATLQPLLGRRVKVDVIRERSASTGTRWSAWSPR